MKEIIVKALTEKESRNKEALSQTAFVSASEPLLSWG